MQEGCLKTAAFSALEAIPYIADYHLVAMICWRFNCTWFDWVVILV